MGNSLGGSQRKVQGRSCTLLFNRGGWLIGHTVHVQNLPVNLHSWNLLSCVALCSLVFIIMELGGKTSSSTAGPTLQKVPVGVFHPSDCGGSNGPSMGKVTQWSEEDDALGKWHNGKIFEKVFQTSFFLLYKVLTCRFDKLTHLL